MTDTLKRLCSPTQLAKTTAGTSLYTPGSGVTASVRNAIATNMMPWDSYLDLALNDISVASNVLVNGLYVPAFKSVSIPLDVIVANAANDSIVGRQRPAYQDLVGTASRLSAPASAVTASAGSASSIATAGWAEVNATAYLMAIAWANSGGAGTISSFTDTHAGITWTQVGSTITSADGITKLAFYTGVSTGTTNTTTTANFSGTQDRGSCMAILSLGTYFDTATAQAAETLCLLGSGEDKRTVTTPQIYLPHQGHSLRVYAAVQQGGNGLTTTVSAGGTEVTDTTNSIANGLTLETAYLLGTAQQNAAVIIPTWSASTGIVTSIGGMVEIFEAVKPIRVALNGVEST